MNEITTAAELDAKSALMAKLCRVLGRDHVDAVHLDLVSALAGDDLWPLMMSFAASRRPDAPARTEPTEEQVAWAIASIYGETCAWGREKGRVCGLCDCNGMTEAYARQAARAVLALLPERVAPSEEEIIKAMVEAFDDIRAARAVQKLYASAPTVAEVKAEAWDEGAERMDSDAFWHDGGRESNPYRQEADRG